MRLEEFASYKSIVSNTLEVDDETLEMLISTYFESTTNDIEELNTFISLNDYESAAKKAHAVKGASASMRIDPLAAALKHLELSAREDRTDECLQHADRINELFWTAKKMYYDERIQTEL